MPYFKNVQSFDDLKSQFRKLALEHHPDAGGDVNAMQAINSEYDQLFCIWKRRSDAASNETSHSTRSEFYTQNGWKGANYNRNLSLKEIACIIREFIKVHYNDFRFSVTTDYGSLTQSLSIDLMEGPCKAFKAYAELTEEERNDVRRTHTQQNNIYKYYSDEIDQEIEKIFDEKYAGKYLTDRVKEAAGAVEDYANSFNRDDSDAMIDYFDTNFYFHGVKIGKWDKPYKIVERSKRDLSNIEYESVKVTKTRKYKALEPQEIPMPEQFEPGQLFRLNSGFNYGCVKGAVYQIDKTNGDFIYAYRLGKGNKNVLKGNIRGNTFNAKFDKFKKWIEQGVIAFVELQEVTKSEEYTSVVRRPKKQIGISAVVSESTDKGETTGKAYSITPDVDTRDNSPLWVVKFEERMERGDFQAVRKRIIELGGYYSRFKHGFIFKFDPAEILKVFDTAA